MSGQENADITMGDRSERKSKPTNQEARLFFLGNASSGGGIGARCEQRWYPQGTAVVRAAVSPGAALLPALLTGPLTVSLQAPRSST